MPAFFPTPYPDELFYSILARYHVRSGNISTKATLMDLYGASTITAVIDLPSHFEALVSRLPVHHRYSTDEFIWNHTLFPFYSAFLPPARSDEILQSMKSSGGSSIPFRVGLIASDIAKETRLKFCPQCVIEDDRQYGESYWHRMHQLPAVYRCPIHQTELYYDQHPRHNRHEFVACPTAHNLRNPMGETMLGESPLNPAMSSNESLSLQFDHLSTLLSTKYDWMVDNFRIVLNQHFVHRPLEWFYEQYINRLIQMGLANVHGQVKHHDLRNAMIEYYGESLLDIFQSPINEQNDNWLQMIVRKPRKSFHPIRHLLIAQFLGLTLPELFEEKQTNHPFGEGPWLCLNAGAEHFQQPVVQDLTIRYDGDIKRPIGTFSCSCGFVYARRGPDISEVDQFKIGRIKTFGQVWEQRLQELLRENLSFREIARRLHVDVKTVQKMGAIQGVDTGSAIGSHGAIKLENSEDEHRQHRQSWLDLAKNHPDLSKKEIRQMNQALYAWLYRHDREWLLNQTTTNSQVQSPKPRVDWDARDQQMEVLVEKAVQELHEIPGKPVPINVSRIGKHIGKSALLERHLDKMPRTKTMLEQVVETDEGYQLRRIDWAVKELEAEGIEPRWWRVARKAGIRDDKIL